MEGERDQGPRLLTVRGVMEQTGLGDSKVRELIHTGALDAIRVGRAIRVPTESLDRWIERCRADAAGS